jgi:hypothetical protein
VHCAAVAAWHLWNGEICFLALLKSFSGIFFSIFNYEFEHNWREKVRIFRGIRLATNPRPPEIEK